MFRHSVDPTDVGRQFCDLGCGCGRDNRFREVWGKEPLRGIEKK